MSKRPVVLMVLDGYGLNDNPEGNAIAMAKTPVMDNLMKDYPFVKGAASGLAVGLPDGQMGNSEVGHMNIGAGRIIYQDLTRITKAIEDGDFFENKGLLTAIENCKKNNSDLHLWGLLSDGGVHSHITHLYGLLEMAKKHGLTNVYVHAFLDGRDTRLHPFPVVIMQWIVIITGIVSRRHMIPWYPEPVYRQRMQ